MGRLAGVLLIIITGIIISLILYLNYAGYWSNKIYIEFDENDNILIEGRYRVANADTLKIGTWISYYPSGSKKYVFNYDDDGLRNGAQYHYHENGNVSSVIEYRKNKKNGEYITYSNNGRILCKGSFTEDKITSGWIWFSENGDTLEVNGSVPTDFP